MMNNRQKKLIKREVNNLLLNIIKDKNNNHNFNKSIEIFIKQSEIDKDKPFRYKINKKASQLEKLFKYKKDPFFVLQLYYHERFIQHVYKIFGVKL